MHAPQGAKIVVFPELSVIGYPPKDLLLKPQFVADNLAALNRIAGEVHGIDAIVGYVEPNPRPVGRPLYNAVALLRDSHVLSKHFKTLLPTYDVFDESRYFEPGLRGERQNIADVAGCAVGLSICEDLWNDEKMIPRRLYHENPIADLSSAGAQIMVNTSRLPLRGREACISPEIVRVTSPPIPPAAGVRESGRRERRAGLRRQQCRVRRSRKRDRAGKGF